MRHHWLYLKYVLRHKWFVFIACRKCKVSCWRAIIHDWHKFLPSEWIPYANFFYGNYPSWENISSGQKSAGYPCSLTKEYWNLRFCFAWNLHQKRARHHWQFWLLTNDNDEPQTVPLQIPQPFLREMVADWWGAGRAITGKWDAQNWYERQKGKIILHEMTRRDVEHLLNETAAFEFYVPLNQACV